MQSGYDVDLFVDQQLDEDLLCPICTNVCMDPFVTETCGHLACHTCFSTWIKTHPNCPVCRASIPGDKNDNAIHRDARLTRVIESLAIQCREPECTWRGTLGGGGSTYRKHMQTTHELAPQPVCIAADYPSDVYVDRRDWYSDGRYWFGSTASESKQLRATYFAYLAAPRSVRHITPEELDQLLSQFNDDLFVTTLRGRRYRTVSWPLKILLQSIPDRLTGDSLLDTHRILLARNYSALPISIPPQARASGPEASCCCTVQ